MSSHAEPTKAFEKLARALLLVGEADRDAYKVRLARRCLDLANRERRLLAGAKLARRIARRSSPLRRVDFSSPLSVAGCPSPTVVRAEIDLVRFGLPVAFELDGKGRHRGTSIDEAIERLNRLGGEPWTDARVIAAYRDYMAGFSMTALASFPDHIAEAQDERAARFRRIPELMAVLDAQREAARPKVLREAGAKPPEFEGRFRVMLNGADVAATFACEEGLRSDAGLPVSPGVLLGVSKRGAFLNRMEVLSSRIAGGGVAVLGRADLWSLLQDEGDHVEIECYEGHWVGWTCFPDRDGEPIGARRFRYYESPAAEE